MFFDGDHHSLKDSIEAIGASFAVYKYVFEKNDFVLVTGNHLYEDIISTTIEKAVDKNLVMLFPRYIEKDLSSNFIECRNTQTPQELEVVVELKESVRWWRFIISPVLDQEGYCNRIINTCIEITDRKMLERKLERTSKRYEAVVQAAYDGIVTINEDQNISMINDSALYIFGRNGERDQLIGKPMTELMPHKFRTKHHNYVDAFKNSIVDSRPMQQRASVRGLRKDGTEFPIEVTISKIDVSGSREMTAVVRDISERALLVEELSKAASEDALTGLTNRRQFTKELLKEISRSKRFKRNVTIAMLDIDHFKGINDSYGHSCGDEVLKDIALMLKDNSRDVDIVSRWGGEEFMVLLPELSMEQARIWANRIRKMVEERQVHYEERVIAYTVSIGLVTDVHENVTFESLVKAVDKRLYKAKEAGRNRIES